MTNFQFEMLISTLWAICGCLMFDKNRLTSIAFYCMALVSSLSCLLILAMTIFMKVH